MNLLKLSSPPKIPPVTICAYYFLVKLAREDSAISAQSSSSGKAGGEAEFLVPGISIGNQTNSTNLFVERVYAVSSTIDWAEFEGIGRSLQSK